MCHHRGATSPSALITFGLVERLREHAKEFIGGLVVVLTILAFLIVLPWPESLIAALVMVVALLGYLLWRAAPPKIDAGDQERLDDLLQLLNRRAVEHIEMQDFYATWNGRIMNPIKVFLLERRGLEHHFRDDRLEEERAALYKAAAEFQEQEASHGFPPQGWGTTADRVPGYSPSEAEMIPEREAAVERHRSAIYPAAQEFLRAHDELVRAASALGYRVDALARERHPDVRQWDRSQDDAEERARSGRL